VKKLSVVTILIIAGCLLFSCAEKAEESAQVIELKNQIAELQQQVQELTKQNEALKKQILAVELDTIKMGVVGAHSG